jgi:hypothetical protein
VTNDKRIDRLSAIVTIAVIVIAGFVAAAALTQAFRQDSWGPIWAMAGSALMIAWLFMRTSRVGYWPHLRRLAPR